MSWAGKLKSAFDGTVDGSDVRGRLASAATLASVRQQLADRRLDAELAESAEPWRVPFVLAPVAAPLWLAEALVTMGQSLAEAEATAHPDRPAAMAQLTHGQLQLLLEPVDNLQAEISGLFADPGRQSAFKLPLLARPFSPSGGGLMGDRVPVSYVRGLLAGATSLAGAVQMLLQDYAKFMTNPTAPAWMIKAFTSLNGDMAAMQTRLDAAEVRSAPIMRQASPDENSLRTLAVDLWDIANSSMKIGQQVSAPSLLPGAQPLPPRIKAVPVIGGAAAPVPSTPAPPRPAADTPLPRIESGPLPPPARAEPSPRPHVEPAPPPRPSLADLTRPAASAAGSAQQPAPAANADRPRSMPDIGGPSVRPAQPSSAAHSQGAAHAQETAVPRTPIAPPTQPSPASGPAGAPPSAPAMPSIQPHAPAAMPAIQPHAPAAPLPQTAGRPVERKDRWLLSSRGARYRLRGAGQEDQAEKDLAAYWDAKGWSLAAAEAQYLDQVTALLASGAVTLSGRSQNSCPFPPIYRATRGGVQVLGRAIDAGSLFSYDFATGGKGLLTNLPAQSGVAD